MQTLIQKYQSLIVPWANTLIILALMRGVIIQFIAILFGQAGQPATLAGAIKSSFII